MASADLTRRLSPAQLFWSNALELHTDTQQMPGDHPVVDVVAGTARHNNVLIVHLLHTFAFFTVVFVPLSSFMDGMAGWADSLEGVDLLRCVPSASLCAPPPLSSSSGLYIPVVGWNDVVAGLGEPMMNAVSECQALVPDTHRRRPRRLLCT